MILGHTELRNEEASARLKEVLGKTPKQRRKVAAMILIPSLHQELFSTSFQHRIHDDRKNKKQRKPWRKFRARRRRPRLRRRVRSGGKIKGRRRPRRARVNQVGVRRPNPRRESLAPGIPPAEIHRQLNLNVKAHINGTNIPLAKHSRPYANQSTATRGNRPLGQVALCYKTRLFVVPCMGVEPFCLPYSNAETSAVNAAYHSPRPFPRLINRQHGPQSQPRQGHGPHSLR